MAEYLIQSETLDDIADAINAKTGGSSAMTPAEMVTEIAAISGGGTEITDGVIIKTRGANGYPLTAEMYCESGVVPPQAFFNGYASGSYSVNTNGYWRSATLLTIKNPVTVLNGNCFTAFHGDVVGDFSGVLTMPGGTDGYNGGSNVFGSSGLTEIDLDSVQSISANNFANCRSLARVFAPKCSAVYARYNATAANAPFGGCTALQEIQLGSVGYACRLFNDSPFIGCTQAGLTVTLFTTGVRVDNTVTIIRKGATNATIIIKASEATTYNGTSYAAGDTILTSEVSA